jgi:hypothetical protein
VNLKKKKKKKKSRIVIWPTSLAPALNATTQLGMGMTLVNDVRNGRNVMVVAWLLLGQ